MRAFIQILAGAALMAVVAQSVRAVPPANVVLDPSAPRRFSPVRPVVSPYLALGRVNAARPVTNLYVIVRPQLQQQLTNAQQSYQISRLYEAQQRIAREQASGLPEQGIRPTGYRSRFMTHHRYFAVPLVP